MIDRLKFAYNRLRERLWIKPLVVCLLSIAGVLLAGVADGTGIGRYVPDIESDSIEDLLKIVAASMLVMATFAVGSMVAAYASASGSATPRSFPLVIADDVSQNALSTFIGVFIFSIVALVALMNGFYDRAGRFTLFVLTAFVFALVIGAFVRWVDSIARLGRLGDTIGKVEAATQAAIAQRQAAPLLGGVAAEAVPAGAEPIVAPSIGYLRTIDMGALQRWAEKASVQITVVALPGTFCTPDQPVAYLTGLAAGRLSDEARAELAGAFQVGGDRAFDHDPRFGLIVLSEIASRALSPAVNDPGTAIDVTGALVRLFAGWNEGRKAAPEVLFDRVAVPRLSLPDLFDDAFTGIARDGAGTVEVGVRLQKAFRTLAALGDPAMRTSALRHSGYALARAERAMEFPPDLDAVRRAAESVVGG